MLDFRKKRQRSRVFFSQEMLDRVAETALEQALTLQLDDRREALVGCIGKLSARDRDLLSRRFAEGSTTQSTATQVGRSPDAVYKALARIRQALFDCVTHTLAGGEHPSHKADTFALATAGPDDLVSVAPMREDLRQDLRRVLQVGRHHHACIAARKLDPTGAGHMRSTVAGQPDGAHTGIRRGEPRGDIKCPVRRVVVHDHEFPVVVRRRHHVFDALVEDGEVLGFAIARGDDADQRPLRIRLRLQIPGQNRLHPFLLVTSGAQATQPCPV